MQPMDDNEVWQELQTAGWEFAKRLFGTWRQIADRPRVVRRALHSPPRRQVALFFLLWVDDQDTMRAVFPDLIDQVSVAHSDMALCRRVIMCMPRRWVLQNIEPVANKVLAQGDYEEYRRLAELYVELDPRLLKGLVQQALAHADPDVREVGCDYRDRWVDKLEGT